MEVELLKFLLCLTIFMWIKHIYTIKNFENKKKYETMKIFDMNLHLLLIAFGIEWALGYPSGGQNSVACYDMAPKHGDNQPNYGTSSYNIYVEELGYNGAFITFQPLSGT
jgi:hypothetical protein